MSVSGKEFAELSVQHAKANSDLHWLCDQTIERVDDIVRKLPPTEAAKLIEAWFGSDFVDFWRDWLGEGEGEDG